MQSFPSTEPVHCSMSSSYCCFLTCIQVSQKAGKVVWYSCLFKNFPQFAVVYAVKVFSIVNEAEVYVFLEFSCFFYDQTDVGNMISASSAFPKSSLYICKCLVHILLNPSLKDFEHYFAYMWNEHSCTVVWTFFGTDCGLPGSSVHGILQARILEWVAIAFSRVSSQPRDRTQVSCLAGSLFTIWTTREAPKYGMLHEFGCHPWVRVLLTFSVSFQV